MKKWFVVVVILVIAAVFYWQRPQPVAVTTVNVTRASISEKVTNTRAGSVMACQRSKLSVPIGGQVVDIFVKEGDVVSQGQLLLSLFNQDIQALLTQAKASASAATLNRQSQCILADADQREANRQAKLKKSGLSTAEMVDMSESKARASEAACAASKAAEQVAQASIELQQASLSKTQLYAPFAGIIAEVNAEQGEFATPSPPGIPTLPLVDLIDNQCYYVSAPIDEVDASALTVGMPVTVHLDALRNQPLQGQVRRIAPYVYAMEKQARTVEVEVSIQPGDSPLLVGYSADVEIVTRQADNALRVPTEAIFNQNQVFVLKDGQLEQREIQLGLSNWQFSEVKRGLNENEQVVITAGRSDLQAGMAAVSQ